MLDLALWVAMGVASPREVIAARAAAAAERELEAERRPTSRPPALPVCATNTLDNRLGAWHE